MKFKALLFTISFMLIYILTFAQEKVPVTNQEIKKGYYSIGNNALKLVVNQQNNTVIKDSFVQVEKGYYSIGSNRRKLAKQGKATSTRPQVQKGYYSIGTNNGKTLN